MRMMRMERRKGVCKIPGLEEGFAVGIGNGLHDPDIKMAVI